MLNRGFEALRKFLHTHLSLNAFLVLRIVFGQYCALRFPPVVSAVARSYCAFVLVFVPCVLLRYVAVVKVHDLDFLAFFVPMIAVPLLTGERPFLRFRAALANADRAACWHCTPKDSRFLYVYFSVALLGQIAIHARYYDGTFHPLANFGYSFISIATELEPLVRLSLFGLIHQRMKLLRESFQSISIDSSRDTEQNRAIRIYRNIKIYKLLLDSMEHVDNTMQLTFGITLTRCTYRAMSLFMVSLTGARGNSEYTMTNYDVLTFLIHITYSLMMACAPCLLVEFAENEGDTILSILARRLTMDAHARVRDAACLGARYVRMRPLRVRLARVLALDSAAPLALLSLCFNYVCIQLQLYAF